MHEPDDDVGDGLPLDEGYQAMLLRELCENTVFSVEATPRLKARYFGCEAYAWAFDIIAGYSAQYNAPPSWAILRNSTRMLDPARRDNYVAQLDAIARRPALTVAQKRWLADQVFDFIVDGMYVAASNAACALHQRGQKKEARELMIKKMSSIANMRAESVQRRWHCDELELRQRQLVLNRDDPNSVITTGFPRLDGLLSGENAVRKGMAMKRLGCWLGYSKGGKSALLISLAMAALRSGAKVLHVVLEGSIEETQARYDASFGQVDSRNAARGDFTSEQYALLAAEYKRMFGSLVIRAYALEEMSQGVTMMDIVGELTYLRQGHDFRPQVIIIDYADLMTGTDRYYRSTVERHVAVYTDLKRLAGDGYVIWTAAQPQRPDENADIKPHVIRSRQVADAYAKIRIADFVGSINSTLAEREAKVARLYCELCRSAPMDEEYVVHADFSTMTISERAGLKSPHADVGVTPAMRRLGDLGDVGERDGRRLLPRQRKAY